MNSERFRVEDPNTHEAKKNSSYAVEGAPHERPALISLVHQLKEPLGVHLELRQVDHLRDAAREVHRGLDGQPALDGLVGAVQLGVGLLQQGAPELVLLHRPQVDELAVPRGELVVHDDLDPLAEAPEAELEDARVAAVEVLVVRDDLLEAGGRLDEVGEGGEEPAVADLALVDVEAVGLAHEHLGIVADLLQEFEFGWRSLVGESG